jgi:outer membrane protein OmpA-like peptidoglycan-associated protein
VIFDFGSANLSEDATNTLDAMIDIIKTSGSNYRILIEGHSDDGDDPENTWGLASRRAVTVADRFSYFGFPDDKIVPISRGTTQKLNEIFLTDSKIEKERKRSLNRRVVLRLLEPKEKKKVKFGFGVYFKDATENIKEDSIDNIDKSDFETN